MKAQNLCRCRQSFFLVLDFLCGKVEGREAVDVVFETVVGCTVSGTGDGGGEVASTWFIRVSGRLEAAVVGVVLGIIDGSNDVLLTSVSSSSLSLSKSPSKHKWSSCCLYVKRFSINPSGDKKWFDWINTGWRRR